MTDTKIQAITFERKQPRVGKNRVIVVCVDLALIRAADRSLQLPCRGQEAALRRVLLTFREVIWAQKTVLVRIRIS